MAAEITRPPNKHRPETRDSASAPPNRFSLVLFVFIYLYFLGEAGEYHTSMFLSQHSWWEKQFRKSVFSLRVTDAGQAFRTDRQLVLIRHLLVSRLWTTTSSPAVLHAQVPSGRRFLRVMRSGETPTRLRGNPTSGLPLSQTFICLFNAQELCFISVLLIVEGLYTSNQTPFFLTSPLSFLSVRWTFAKKRGGKGQPILRENASVILAMCAGTDFKQVRTRHPLHHPTYSRESQVLPIAEKCKGFPSLLFFIFSSAQILQPTALTIIFLSKNKASKPTLPHLNTFRAMSRDYQNESVRSICLHWVTSTISIYIKIKLLTAVLNTFSSHW